MEKKLKLNKEELFVQRTCDLARLGGANVSPNPMVGAVIVADNRIIGEGYHMAYGTPHAEVNAVNNVKEADKHLLDHSTIYVSLEPCCVQGKTPPCTDLILDRKIPRVVISALDRSPDVNGKSLGILQKAGVSITRDVLADQGKLLSLPRNTFVSQQRPYVILKYARSIDGFMASREGKQIWISNAFTSRLTHKWRSEVNAILVGRKTALIDDPALTTRHYFGANPLRVVLDRELTLKPDLKIFDDKAKTIVFNESLDETKGQVTRVKVPFDKKLINNVLQWLYLQNIETLMVEGGPTLLRSFYESNLWDEARIITGPTELQDGIEAPMPDKDPLKTMKLGTDEINVFFNPAT